MRLVIIYYNCHISVSHAITFSLRNASCTHVFKSNINVQLQCSNMQSQYMMPAIGTIDNDTLSKLPHVVRTNLFAYLCSCAR